MMYVRGDMELTSHGSRGSRGGGGGGGGSGDGTGLPP